MCPIGAAIKPDGANFRVGPAPAALTIRPRRPFSAATKGDLSPFGVYLRSVSGAIKGGRGAANYVSDHGLS